MGTIKKIAVCCLSGGYKNAFTQGVLTAFEEKGLLADVYTACSSSALIAAFAAFQGMKQLDLTLWENGYAISREDGGDQSRAMLHSIQQLSPVIKSRLWEPSSARLAIATSRVSTGEVAAVVQSEGARRLGQKLLLSAMRHDAEWKDKNLRSELFDTHPDVKSRLKSRLLTKENFDEVAYATTRMLHAWKIPASIENCAYMDGSYSSHFPVDFLRGLKCDRILCIATEKAKVFTNLFMEEEIPSRIDGVPVDTVKPDFDLKDMGLDYYTITGEGLHNGFEHGYHKGMQ